MAFSASAGLLLLCASSSLPRVPVSPDAMVSAASRAISAASSAGHRRLVVRLVVPPLPSVAPEDLDPWPGGLAQQYPYALELARALMGKTVGCKPASVRHSVLSAEDACGLLLAEGKSAADDAACLLFAGPDQLEQLAQTEAMVGNNRLLVLLNPQWRRLSDFAPAERKRAAELFFERGYKTGYAFDELACRGEDVKLVGGVATGWRAFIMLEDTDMDGVCLHDEDVLDERPSYEWLEKAINTRHPSPRWARKLDQVEARGPVFLRKKQGGDGQ